MDAAALVRTRPYAYHLTARAHLQPLQSHGRLDSAERLCTSAGRTDLLKHRRLRAEHVVRDGACILIRDQRPLHESKMDLDGRLFADLLADINRRVFFWAGKKDGPGAYCEAHFGRYAAESPIVLRILMADL